MVAVISSGSVMKMLSLNDREWKDFSLVGVFDKNQRGKRLKKADHTEGNVPYVSSTAMHNGVDGFIEKTDSCRTFENCISLNNSGSVGKAFYEPFEFVASDHVTHLKKDDATEEQYLFLTAVIEMQSSNFSFNREINDERLNHMRIMLPVDEEGNPDWEFMGAYIQERKEQLVKNQIAFLEREISRIGGGYENFHADLEGVEWREIPIGILFSSFENGKGKGLNHLNKVEKGGIEYIGATNRNDGVLCFVEENDESKRMIQSGNCIGFIRNGDGSAGYAIYKARDFISTSDVMYGYADWLNEYTGRFFVVAQDMIKAKYSHGHKRSAERLKSDKVMLPVDVEGNPDWEFMDGYIRKQKLDLLKKEIAYLKRDLKAA